jgi:hypothetical protein
VTIVEALITYLHGLGGDIFKLLPMKEDAINGADNHLSDYLDTLLGNIIGATKTFSILETDKNFIYIKNNMQYLANEEMTFSKWRKTVLNSVALVEKMSERFRGDIDD